MINLRFLDDHGQLFLCSEAKLSMYLHVYIIGCCQKYQTLWPIINNFTILFRSSWVNYHCNGRRFKAVQLLIETIDINRFCTHLRWHLAHDGLHSRLHIYKYLVSFFKTEHRYISEISD